jgi:hypothetical protein
MNDTVTHTRTRLEWDEILSGTMAQTEDGRIFRLLSSEKHIL